MSVVKETRQIFSVEDIKAIRLQCKKCQTEVVLSPLSPYIDRCPYCSQVWHGQRSRDDPNDLLLNAIKEIVEQPPELVTIRFEIDDGVRELTG